MPKAKPYYGSDRLASHDDDDRVIELDLTEVYKLVQWLNKFPTQK